MCTLGHYGVIVNGTPIKNISYVNDTVLLVTSLEELQILLNIVEYKSAEFGLN